MAKANAKDQVIDEATIADDEGLEGIVNFSDDITDAAPVPLLPERDYDAEITRVDIAKGEKGLYATITWHIGVDDFPADYNQEDAPDGKDIRQVLGLRDDKANRHRLRKYCEAIGAPMGKQLRPREWVNLRGRVTVKHDSYNGEEREKISKVQAA